MKRKINKSILCTLFIWLNGFSQEQIIFQKSEYGNIEGSLLIPKGNSKPPLILLISGSGPTDRNGNQDEMQNNSLKMIADTLYKSGIASFRFDKRGIGESKSAMSSERDMRFEHFVNDVKNWITILSKDKRISKIIVAGHSEGSLIGIVASGNNKLVSGFISIAGAGRPADEIIKEQLSKLDEKAQKIILPMIDRLKAGDSIANVPPILFSLFRPSIQRYMTSWFKYSPQVEIKKLKIPVLILQGNTDIQVKVKDAELLSSALPAARVSIILSMNHVLKDCDSTNKEIQKLTYDDPKLPLSKAFCMEIISFMKSFEIKSVNMKN